MTTETMEKETIYKETNVDSSNEESTPVDSPTVAKKDRDPDQQMTLLFNGCTWKHDAFIEGAFGSLGYSAKALPTPDVPAFQLGKEFGNNGQCNPTYFTVGNLVQYLQKLEQGGMTRQEIIDKYAFFTFGSDGPCRFGMYVEEYRLALRNAGFHNFRIELANMVGGINQETEEKALVTINMDLIFGLINSFCLGDIMTSIGYQIRPYEVNAGETDKVMQECTELIATYMKNRTPYEIKSIPGFIQKRFPGIGEGIGYVGKFLHQLTDKGFEKTLEHCRDRFNSIKVDRTRSKPTVKIIGEFWAQTTEGDGNFNMFKFLEREGSQCIVEPVATWVPYLLLLARQNAETAKNIQAKTSDSFLKKMKQKIGQRFKFYLSLLQFKVALKIFLREYNRFADVFGELPTHMLDQDKLVDLAQPFYNSHVDGGEGHLEIAKAIYYTTEDKAHMVLSLKPFGCMPSTQSDGAMAQVVSKYKDMIFLPIETSGEGEVNAHSRVQMALGEAKHKTKAEYSQTLEQIGYSLQQVRSYVADHQELQTPMYKVPVSKGVVGTGANFLLHVADRMQKDGIQTEVLKEVA